MTDVHAMSVSSEKMKFGIGHIYITSNAMQVLAEEDTREGLRRHMSCDWGDVGAEDWKWNDQALEQGTRLLSSYKSVKGEKFWIITEADRLSTTILLPEDY